MKRTIRSMLGVTLLEIMLVLAIASMVIVMSIRYYQSASSSQQANAALSLVQGITAASDSIAQGAGGYVTAGLSPAVVGPLLPNGSATPKTPWATAVTISPSSETLYTVTFPLTPGAVCQILKVKLKASANYNVTSACGTAAADFTYTYTSAPTPAP